MITRENLEKLATQYQMGVFPNIVREYFQHFFLSELYKLLDSEKVLFKGGTALRIIYNSPRFSEDLDFSVLATFKIMDYSPVAVEINVSSRNGKVVNGEADSVTNNFVPTYTVIHLPQSELVEEKIFGALVERKKPRDFYDLYFMLRSRMLSADHKNRLGKLQKMILNEISKTDFKSELSAFLPADQQAVARDFQRALRNEMERQLSSI